MGMLHRARLRHYTSPMETTAVHNKPGRGTVALTKRQRVIAALEGRVADLDRPPASVWYHFGTHFMGGRAAADVAAAFFRHYDFDFLKMMNDRPWPSRRSASSSRPSPGPSGPSGTTPS